MRTPGGPVETAVLDRLGDMPILDRAGAFQVGDRARDSHDGVMGPGRKPETVGGLVEDPLPAFGGRNGGPLRRLPPGRGHARRHDSTRLRARGVPEVPHRQRRHLDLKLEPVEQGPRHPRLSLLCEETTIPSRSDNQ